MSALLSVSDISVAYGGVAAVAPLNFAVEAGECLAILGANGAGKSSLLRGIMGLTPASGDITFGGADVTTLATADRARRGIAFVPEGRRVFAGMTVRENLEAATDRSCLHPVSATGHPRHRRGMAVIGRATADASHRPGDDGTAQIVANG